MSTDKNFYINFDRGTRVNSDGSNDSSTASLYYQEVPNWSIRFIDDNQDAVDLSSIASWACACDDDFDHDTDPWVRVLDADIDSTQANEGIITVPVDSDTSTFLAGIGTSDYKSINFELRGLDADGKLKAYCRFAILAKNTLDSSGGTPPDPVGNYYTKTESDALYVANVSGVTVDNIVTFKADGSIQDSGINIQQLIDLINLNSSSSSSSSTSSSSTSTSSSSISYSSSSSSSS